MLILLLALVIEQVFGNFHPQFLLQFLIFRFIRILLGHLDVLALKSYLHSLVEMVQNGIDDDLSLFHILALSP